MQLTARQQTAIETAGTAMRDSLKTAYPEDFPVLFVAAVTGLFASLVNGELGRQLLNVINDELRPANLMLARRTGFGSPNNPAARVKAARRG
jgi:hypothetical protein